MNPILSASGSTTEGKEQVQQQHALQSFQRDLPQLWRERPGQWVAYQGERRIGFASQKHELYQQCFQLGLDRAQFVVFCIEPQETEMVLGPVVLD